jgi:hypothetical protein
MAGQSDGQSEKSGGFMIDKRTFVTSIAGVAGAIGGAAALSTISQSAMAQTAAMKPRGLLPGATLDSRFPASFATSVPEGLRLVMEFYTAMSQRDVEGMAKTLHYPFAIYEHIEPLIVNSAEEFVRNPPPSLNSTGKGYSTLNPGSYDLLQSVNVHLYCPVGGVFSLSFRRYTADGQKLLDSDGFYSVTNNDGRWGIQLISTIVAERGYEDLKYPDAGESARIAEQGYLAAFGYRDEKLLDDLSKGRGTYEPRLPVGTKTASVNFGYGPRERTLNAKSGDPMAGWITKGVKSRLVVKDITADIPEYHTNLAQFVSLAGEAVGTYGYTRLLPDRPLVIHATNDKAHLISGYWRYTPDSVLISETRGAGIRVYKGGHWGSSGNLGQVTHHDRSNSKT